ncbi:MAG TPA: DUF5941 domain-containing protein [Streptosporangiaceae bacterium]|nr:DUF5941 domain-containing protein [Streptosporangiaceae bacterium]
MAVVGAVDVLPERVARWASRRRLAPVSLSGIGLACSLSAAAWFSAGVRQAELFGAVALVGAYLARRISREVMWGEQGADAPPRSAAAGLRGAEVAWPQALFDRWLARVASTAGEFTVYAGLAAGAIAAAAHAAAGAGGSGGVARATSTIGRTATLVSPGWLPGPHSLIGPGALVGSGRLAGTAWIGGGPASTAYQNAWLLALGAAVLLAVRQMVRMCKAVAAGRRLDEAEGRPWRMPVILADRILGLRARERTVLIAVTAVGWGPQAALIVLTGWGALSAIWAIAARPRPVAGVAPVPDLAGRLDAGDTATSNLAGSRDDGAFARFTGRAVRGQLVPFPPAAAGLTATVLLALLGLRDLSGLLLLAPVAAMLLAAPGSAHPHDGPLDWIVPAILLAGECAYLIALGAATGVPWPLTFFLASLVCLRHLDVAVRALAGSPSAVGTALGWEGRMLGAGFVAMIGFSSFAFIALSVYIVALLCRNGLGGWLAVREGQPDTQSDAAYAPAVVAGGVPAR